MTLSFRKRQRKEKRRRHFIVVLFIGVLLLCASGYFYGSRINVAIHMKKARTYFLQGNLDQSLMEYNKVLEMLSNYPPAIDGIGLIYLSQGDLVRAEIKYDQALKQGLKPNRKLNHTKVGYNYLRRGIYPPAELEFRHALDMTPKDPQTQLGHALSLHALGQLKNAIDGYRKSLSLNPDLKLAQQKINQAREELDRDFITYIADRNNKPLARYRTRSNSNKRYYTLSQYASHLIGYVSQKHGTTGLERALEPYLPGNTVSLTIDGEWQRAAHKAMGWRKGSLVAINPKTGEILAMVNQPTFNPNTVDKDWKKITGNQNTPLKNRAMEGLYKPGSIFKIITSAAALEAQLDLGIIFPVNCTNAIRYSGKTFWCWLRHGQIDSLQAALDTSCNIAMAEVGFTLGPDRMYEYSNKFGFGLPLVTSFESNIMDLSQPIATSIAPMVSDSRFDLAERSCGLGQTIKITPLHAALLAATIANQGVMMKPYFIKEVKNIQDQVIAKGIPAKLRQPIQPETATKLRDFMIDTVQHGIGKKAQIKGLTVAGKTGTTGDSRRGLNGWFICFAPAENPQVAVAIYAEKEGSGKDVAAPIARLFFQQVLKAAVEKK